MINVRKETYQYNNLSIPGGGYVTGFVYHKNFENILYARTDIGGAYRFDYDKERWISLVDHVTMEDISETFPISIALDDSHPERVYIASGINGRDSGVLSISEDYGKTFSYRTIPTMVHGNLNGRGTDERLLVDKNDSKVLYFASQTGGLYKSTNGGEEFVKMSAMPEDYLTLICEDATGKALIVGTAGVTTKDSDTLRGHGLYVSFDGGESFAKMWVPERKEVPGIKLAGFVPQRVTLDDEFLYVTYSVMGYNAYVLENGYSCDGGSVVGGKVIRYKLENLLADGEDITPIVSDSYTDENGLLVFGFSGIARQGDILTVSTISKEDGDCIYRSMNQGGTWECVLHGLDKGRMEFRTSYMKPEYNGGGNLIHWLTCLAVNPFNNNELWFNTGTGAFRTKNFLDDEVVFQDWSDGIEETVHLNLYSPVSGDVKVIDILGDLGGFAFTQFEKPCDNSFADSEGNRYITCINADYSDINSDMVIVTPRGNWTGKTKGGLIVSNDQCKTWTRLKMPYGISKVIDVALSNMENPNVNSGWVAMSPDGEHIVWSIANWCDLPVDRVIVSHNRGESFSKVKIVDYEKNLISSDSNAVDTHTGMKVFADRVCSNIFYGFGEESRVYVSTDYGSSFFEIDRPWNFPIVDFSMIDCANKTEIRAENGKMGVFYMALGDKGLWKMIIDPHNRRAVTKRIDKEGDVVYRVGLGKMSETSDYLKDDKALYVAAIIGGKYGFYRITGDGKEYVLISDKNQGFGEINSVEGDSQIYGRFYIGTGTRGVLYGEPAV